MTNLFISMMKDYLNIYYKKQKEFNSKIDNNNKTFSPEYAEKENAKIREQQAKEYKETVADIKNIFDEVKSYLASANFIDVSSLTADRLLFDNNSGFDLSVEEVKAFAERYKDNNTMLRLIKDWVEKHNDITKEHPAGKYADVNIILPSDKIASYQKFGESAISICGKIYNNGLIMQNPLEIEYFDNEEYNKTLFDVIGNGNELKEYKGIKHIPDMARHIFDDVKLAGTEMLEENVL